MRYIYFPAGRLEINAAVGGSQEYGIGEAFGKSNAAGDGIFAIFRFPCVPVIIEINIYIRVAERLVTMKIFAVPGAIHAPGGCREANRGNRGKGNCIIGRRTRRRSRFVDDADVNTVVMGRAIGIADRQVIPALIAFFAVGDGYLVGIGNIVWPIGLSPGKVSVGHFGGVQVNRVAHIIGCFGAIDFYIPDQLAHIGAAVFKTAAKQNKTAKTGCYEG